MSMSERVVELLPPAHDGEAELGERVTVIDLTTSAVRDYRLVERVDDEVSADEVSVRAPLGSALLGRHVGDVVSVEESGGRIVRLEVVEIDG